MAMMGLSSERDLNAVSARLSELSALLSERVASDRSLLSEVKQHTSLAAKAASGEVFRSLFTELLLSVDRLRIEEASPELNESIAEEILDICANYGLEQVETGGVFDPRIHEAAAIVPTAISSEDRTVASVERPGYRLAGALLRPARVVVARYDASLASEGGNAAIEPSNNQSSQTFQSEEC